MKTCFKCHETKPLAEFYAHPRMADGHLNKCKTCTKADSSRRYNAKITDPVWKLQERDRQRLKERKRRARGVHIRPSAQCRKNWQLRNLHKMKAVHAVGRAVRAGQLTRKPCEQCGNPRVQAHHDDYSKPLQVRWLCVPCHAAHHVNMRRTELLSQIAA
jgi:ribosomal protein S27AE